MASNFFGRSGNPALKGNVFKNETALDGGETMTVQGSVNKTLVLLFLVITAAAFSWYFLVYTGMYQFALPLMIGTGVIGFVLSLITIFNKKASPVTAPLYTVFEGIFLGIISLFFEKMYHGIVLQAVFLTFGILLSMLILYKTHLIQVTQNLRLGIAAATGGVFFIYMINMVLRLFGVNSFPFIHEGGTWGILFSLVVVVIASLNLVLDFDFIESGEKSGAPKYMEWYGAFGLMVTLIWLYLEILRLLSKFSRR